MALVFKSLYAADLPNTKTTLYTATGEVAIKQICLVEKTGSAHTVTIYLKRSGGTSSPITPVSFPMNAGDATFAAQADVLENTMEMSANDEIEGEADAATSIRCVITGAEVTP